MKNSSKNGYLTRNLEIPTSLKVRLIAEQLIKIEGESYALNINDFYNDYNPYCHWSIIDRYEIWINHRDETLDVFLFDHGSATYEIDGLLLIVAFSLKTFHRKGIIGQKLLEEINNAILLGIKEFQQQRPDQQLNLFEDSK